MGQTTSPSTTAGHLLTTSPVIPVVVIKDARQAVPLAQALARGGVGVIEITLRTPAGLAAIERVAAEVPEILVGAGTVTTTEDWARIETLAAEASRLRPT